MRALHSIDWLGRWLTVALPLLILTGPAIPDIAASLIALLFLLRSAITRDFTWLRMRWLQLLLLLTLYLCIRNAFISVDGLLRGLTWVRFPLLAASLACWSLRDARTQKHLRATLLAALVFLVLDTLWQYRVGYDVFGRSSLRYIESTRLTGPLSSARVGITIVWLMFPALLWLVAQPRPALRLSGIVLLGMTVLAVFVSGERTALLLMLMGCVAGFLLVRRVRWLLGAAGLACIAVAIYLVQVNPQLGARQIDATHQQIAHFSQSTYGLTWQSAARVAAAHPLFGVGLKQFRSECRKPQYGPMDIDRFALRCPNHTHNFYLELAAESGLVGLALMLAVIASWAKLVRRQWPRWKGDPLMAGLVITLAIRLFPLSVVPSQFVPWSAVPFWLIVGWLMGNLAAGRDKS